MHTQTVGNAQEGLAPKKNEPPPANAFVSAKNVSRFASHCGSRTLRYSSCPSGDCYLAS